MRLSVGAVVRSIGVRTLGVAAVGARHEFMGISVARRHLGARRPHRTTWPHPFRPAAYQTEANPVDGLRDPLDDRILSRHVGHVVFGSLPSDVVHHHEL